MAIAIASLLSYRWGLMAYGGDLIKARTIVFTSLITAELLRAFSSRSQKYTLFNIGLFTNKTMVFAVLISFTLLLLVVYVPFLQPIFNTTALGLKDWPVILGFAVIPLIVGELSKVIFKEKVNKA